MPVAIVCGSGRYGSKAETERVLKAFEAAADAGDMAGLVELLDPEAVYVATAAAR